VKLQNCATVQQPFHRAVWALAVLYYKFVVIWVAIFFKLCVGLFLLGCSFGALTIGIIPLNAVRMSCYIHIELVLRSTLSPDAAPVCNVRCDSR